VILFSNNYFENGLPESCFKIDDPLSVLNGLSYGDLPIPGQPEMHHVGGGHCVSLALTDLFLYLRKLHIDLNDSLELKSKDISAPMSL